MSEVCEIVESFASATSSCPSIDVIAVQTSSGSSKSSVALGLVYPLLVATCVASSQITSDAYAMSSSTAQAVSSVYPAITVDALVTSHGRGTSALIATYEETANESASATSSIVAMDVPQLLTSTAHASSQLTVNTTASQLLTSVAQTRSTLTLGRQESAVSSANATSSLVLRRDVIVVAESSASSGSTLFVSNTPQPLELVSTANATSSTSSDTTYNALLTSAAVAISNVWYKDPTRVAWVLNTESTAACWYNNFDFESITQVGNKVLAVGPDGLYEFTGDTDVDEPIDATIVSGFMDFGTANTKRVDTLYLGYNSLGQISITAEAHESKYPPYTYLTEPIRSIGDVPRANRIVLGKGLWGRYWRMTLQNIDGVAFEVHDMSVDLAVSPRRL